MLKHAVNRRIDPTDLLDTAEGEKVEALAYATGVTPARMVIRKDAEHALLGWIVASQFVKNAHLAGCAAADVGIIEQRNERICPAHARKVHLEHPLWHAFGLVRVVLLFLWNKAFVSRLAQAADVFGVERALVRTEKRAGDVDTHVYASAPSRAANACLKLG